MYDEMYDDENDSDEDKLIKQLEDKMVKKEKDSSPQNQNEVKKDEKEQAQKSDENKMLDDLINNLDI